MKRFAAILLCLLAVLSLAACSSSVSADINEVDLSAYPSDFSEWTLDDVMSYFADAGVFTEDDWEYTITQSELGIDDISAVGSYMSREDESITVLIYSFETAEESSEVAELLEYVRENEAMYDNDTWSAETVDHLFGDFAIHYSLSSDDSFVNTCEAAYEQLIEDMSVTPEF